MPQSNAFKFANNILTNGGYDAADLVGAAGGTQPSFSATMSTNQNITNSTQTKVQFNTERFDTNNNYDSTTNYRFTPTVAGKYQINAGLGTNANTTNPTELLLSIFKNGSAYNKYDTEGYASGYKTPIISSIIDLNGSTDYVEIYVVYTGANGGFIDTSSARCWFDGSLIS